jgi:type II secretory pathway component PulC
VSLPVDVDTVGARRRLITFLLVIGVSVLPVATMVGPEKVAAQTQRRAVDVTSGESVSLHWRLRGVVLTEPARIAVVQRGPNSREQLLRVGDPLEHGVAVVSIAPDRVVLDAQGDSVTLYLAHGAEQVTGRRFGPPSSLPSILNRRGR